MATKKLSQATISARIHTTRNNLPKQPAVDNQILSTTINKISITTRSNR